MTYSPSEATDENRKLINSASEPAQVAGSAHRSRLLGVSIVAMALCIGSADPMPTPVARSPTQFAWQDIVGTIPAQPKTIERATERSRTCAEQPVALTPPPYTAWSVKPYRDLNAAFSNRKKAVTERTAPKKRGKTADARDLAASPRAFDLPGGPGSDDWNRAVLSQPFQTPWLQNRNQQKSTNYFSATLAALMMVAPKHEREKMRSAQLLAAYNAAMDCYRRAMFGEPTFGGT